MLTFVLSSYMIYTKEYINQNEIIHIFVSLGFAGTWKAFSLEDLK